MPQGAIVMTLTRGSAVKSISQSSIDLFWILNLLESTYVYCKIRLKYRYRTEDKH